MEIEKVIKGNQEQAAGVWINYLNQVRINELMDALSKQNTNFAYAITTIDKTLEIIQSSIIERNRGGVKGMHGFIAEIAECGIGNARQQIEGRANIYEWVNDNSPVDLIRDGLQIQQKFVRAGGHLSLGAVKEHLEKYPDYLKNGGVYQIPKDHYERIKYLLSMPEDVANKLPTSTGEFSLKQWKEIHDFFENGTIDINSLEPSTLNYDEVQANTINTTLEQEKSDLSKADQSRRDNAYKKSKPTLKEGAKVTVVSSFIEGGTTFCLELAKKRKDGKFIKDFDENDWKEIAGDSGVSFVKGGIRGASIYSLTNYTATPAAVASSIVTASFGVAEQAHMFRIGKINEREFIENSELLCLDASVSALSSFIGQVAIPIPLLGAVVGNTVGTLMYQIAKDKFSEKEQAILYKYAESLQKLDEQLIDEYQQCIAILKKDFAIYMSLLEQAFSSDIKFAFEGSAKLAKELGVPTEEILDTPEKVKVYFTE